MNTQHHDRESSLESRLRADARAARVAPPEGLEQRISAAVWREAETARSAPRVEPRRRSFRLFPPALAGLLTSACAVALVILWHQRTDDPALSDADLRTLAAAVQTLPARLAATELPAATTLTVSGPLVREIESVRADARNALGFLAANFLPSDARAAVDDGDATPVRSET